MSFQKFEQGDRDNYLKWIAANPHGFVWVVKRKKFHSAQCSFMQPRIKSVKHLNAKSITARACASSRIEMAQHFPDASNQHNDCQACKPT